jgi:hypothetical protein
MNLRCLSIWEPWATLILRRAKRVETRDWASSYRGAIGIHASVTFRPEQRLLCASPEFAAVLGEDPQFHLGCLLGVGKLTACFRLGEQSTYRLLNGRDLAITAQERAFGNFAPGRFGWLIEDVVALEEPIAVRGYPALWTMHNVPLPVQQAIRTLYGGS